MGSGTTSTAPRLQSEPVATSAPIQACHAAAALPLTTPPAVNPGPANTHFAAMLNGMHNNLIRRGVKMHCN